MNGFILTCLLLCSLPNPATELEACANDAKRLPRSHWRYVSLYNLDESQHEEYTIAVNGLLNHCSRADVIIPPQVPFEVTLPDKRTTKVIRFDLSWYATPDTLSEVLRAWEDMYSEEPYFAHPLVTADDTFVVVVVLDKALIQSGTEVVATVRRGSTFEVLAVQGDWHKVTIGGQDGWIHKRFISSFGRTPATEQRFSVSPTDAEILKDLTGTALPVVRADWLLKNIMLEAKNYFALAGIPKTEAEFARTCGVDQASFATLQTDFGANVNQSPVVNGNRRISYTGSRNTSILFLTRDPNSDTDPNQNPFQAGIDFEYHGVEGIGRGANGLQRYWTGNGEGKRVDLVPPDVAAVDYSMPSTAKHKQIVAPYSCQNCHNLNGSQRGYVFLNNDQLNFMRAQLAVRHKNPAEAAARKRFYGGDLGGVLLQEGAAYNAKVAEACNIIDTGNRSAVKIYTDAACGGVDEYKFTLVTPKVAARELGLELEHAQAAFAAYEQQYPEDAGAKDRVFVFGLFRDGQPCSRGAWEAGYAFAWSVIYGI